jgi:hypothetical protein
VLIVHLEESEPGMRLAMPVRHPEHPDQELLRRGFVLDKPVQARLRELGIRWIYVDYPGLQDLDRHLAATLSPERQTLYCHLKASLSHFEQTAAPSVDYWDYYSTTRDFLTTLLANGPHPLYLEHLSRDLGGGAVEHGVAVAHLALCLGLRLEPYLVRERKRLRSDQAKDILNLGVAGMLHDLGKTRLPAHLRDAHALNLPANDSDRAEWQAHAAYGYEMLRHTIKPTAASAILNHHQHFDGTGLVSHATQQAQQIHVYARILLAADVYDRLAIADEGRRRRTNLEILHLMRDRYADRLDPEILAAMPKVVPPFPPGSRVTLSDGRTAVVTDMEPEHPYRPIIRCFTDDGESLESDSIGLRTCPELSICEVGGFAVGDTVPELASASAD